MPLGQRANREIERDLEGWLLLGNCRWNQSIFKTAYAFASIPASLARSTPFRPV